MWGGGGGGGGSVGKEGSVSQLGVPGGVLVLMSRYQLHAESLLQ